MIQVRDSVGQSGVLARLHQSAKRDPIQVSVLVSLGLAGLAWALVKLVFAAGFAAVLTLLRDAGHQVGGGGIPGAGGAGGAGSGAPGTFPSVPTVKGSGKGVQVGNDHDGWRDAAPGTEIGPGDFVRVPEGSSVTISRPDGGTERDVGKSLIPGRRLTGDVTPASWGVIISKGLQHAAETIVGEQNPQTGACLGSKA